LNYDSGENVGVDKISESNATGESTFCSFQKMPPNKLTNRQKIHQSHKICLHVPVGDASVRAGTSE